MSGGVSGDYAELRALRQRLASLPEVNAQIAQRAAPAVTAAFQGDFSARRSPYGAPWRTKGGAVSLDRTGRLRAGLRFVPLGTRLRFSLSVPYARFHLWRGFGPGKTLPAEWEAVISKVATVELDRHMGGGR